MELTRLPWLHVDTGDKEALHAIEADQPGAHPMMSLYLHSHTDCSRAGPGGPLLL